MFARELIPNAFRPDPAQAISIRAAYVAFAAVTLFLAFTPARSLGASDGAGADEGSAAVPNLLAEARGATPANMASPPAVRSDGPAGNCTAAFTSSDSTSCSGDFPSGLLRTDAGPKSPARSTRCLLFVESFCQAVRKKPLLALTGMQTAALVSDGVTTRQFLRRGYTEVDPLARMLIGSRPTWARMAPLGAVQVAAGMWLAERMASSQRRWVRRFWWLPQFIGSAANAAGAAHNTKLR